MKNYAVTLFVLLFFLANFGFAKEASKAAISIQSIDYKIFDRQKGKFISAAESPSDPYGLHSDLYIEVKLKGNVESANGPLKIVLNATTPKTSDEARGSVAATAQTLTKDDVYLADEGEITTIPFLLKFRCNPMIIKVELPTLKISKQIKAGLVCAE